MGNKKAMGPHYRFTRWYGDLAKRFGVSELIGRLAAVLILHRGKEISLQELADWTEYSLSAVSQTIDTFVRMGFAERRKRKGDRRAFFCTRQSLPEVMHFFIKLIAEEEIHPSIQELQKELNEAKTEAKSADKEKKEELNEKIATLENLLEEASRMERYMADLLAVKLPKPGE
ncbi:MAG: MarR family transcriptional regulator [Candidatus Hodarchaeota archaeon]